MQAVMIYAQACDKLPFQQCQSNFSAVLEAMRSISFVGKSGLVQLDKHEDRLLAAIEFRNYRLNLSDCFFRHRACAHISWHAHTNCVLFF